MEQAASKYITWKGGTVIDTPTIGTPRFETQLVSGKAAKVQVGWMRAKGGQGKQDHVWIYKSITVFVDYKVGSDTQKDSQRKVQARIERSGGVYLLIHDMDEVYAVIDYIDAHGTLHGLKFYEK